MSLNFILIKDSNKPNHNRKYKENGVVAYFAEKQKKVLLTTFLCERKCEYLLHKSFDLSVSRLLLCYRCIVGKS
jgi:hypothetical protein